MVDTPEIFKAFSTLKSAQSTRFGGISDAPFASLNLGFSTADPLENVLENRKRFFATVGVDENNVAFSGQIHGAEIWKVDEDVERANGKIKSNTGHDAIITNHKNIFIVVGIADCCPVLIYDKKNKAVAAIHAGWRGTALNIVAKTLERMQHEYGTEAKDCFAYIGTCISECAFEVGPEVAEQFKKEFVRWEEKKKKHFVDLKSANNKQLENFGLPKNQIEISTNCTVLNNDNYFSYRLENGNTGRMLAGIGMF